MTHGEFVHLRTHTAYSLLEGALKNGKVAELCRRYGMPAVTMTLAETWELTTSCEQKLLSRASRTSA